jgi:hypothetical protein
LCRQEVHFDAQDAVTLAGFAASAFDVEGIAPSLLARITFLYRYVLKMPEMVAELPRPRREVNRRPPTRLLKMPLKLAFSA